MTDIKWKEQGRFKWLLTVWYNTYFMKITKVNDFWAHQVDVGEKRVEDDGREVGGGGNSTDLLDHSHVVVGVV